MLENIKVLRGMNLGLPEPLQYHHKKTKRSRELGDLHLVAQEYFQWTYSLPRSLAKGIIALEKHLAFLTLTDLPTLWYRGTHDFSIKHLLLWVL